MLIKSNADLFFNATIQDYRWDTSSDESVRKSYWRGRQYSEYHYYLPLRIFFLVLGLVFEPHRYPWRSVLEEYADSCLAETRYWFSGKKIELFDEYVVVIDEQRKFVTTIDKIKSFITAFFLFLPGVCLKGLLWLINHHEINRRNFWIIAYLNDEQNYNKQLGTHLYSIQPKTLKLGDGQSQSQFLCMPSEIIRHTLSYLKNHELVAAIKTCKKIYRLSTDQYSSKVHTTFPDVISQSMANDVLANLPRGFIPKGMQTLFAIAKRDLRKNYFSVSSAKLEAWDLTDTALKSGCLKDLIKSMGNHAMQSFQTPEGPGLVIRLSSDYDINFPILIVAKIQGDWIILGIGITGAMQLFLNDLHFSPNNAPELKDYFTRLFNGQPCGDFWSQSDVEFDYKGKRAGEILDEGKRTRYNGTSVIKLWRS